MRESFAPVQRNAMPTAPARTPGLISKVGHSYGLTPCRRPQRNSFYVCINWMRRCVLNIAFKPPLKNVLAQEILQSSWLKINAKFQIIFWKVEKSDQFRLHATPCQLSVVNIFCLHWQMRVVNKASLHNHFITLKFKFAFERPVKNISATYTSEPPDLKTIQN